VFIFQPTKAAVFDALFSRPRLSTLKMRALRHMTAKLDQKGRFGLGHGAMDSDRVKKHNSAWKPQTRSYHVTV
jgi:hypothetical protein